MLNYYDPMFYISSEKMPFTIRIEVKLKYDKVDGIKLSHAVNKAIQRYPYFAIKIQRTDSDLIAVPNNLPIVVYQGQSVLPLGSIDVNYHLVSVSYSQNEIFFYASHVITDGSGLFPFIKTALYYYLCDAYETELDPKGIRLISEPFYDDEINNPYPEEKMNEATPFCKTKDVDFFNLKNGGFITDHNTTVYRIRMNELEVMNFSHDNDGSPCALISSLMTKAIWSIHQCESNNIVCAISFNMRPGLGNKHNYRMLCNALKLSYPNKMRQWDITKLCTCSRGMVTLQSQDENVLYYAKCMRARMEELIKITDIEEKKRIIGDLALSDSINNTFSVSYVGQMNLGSIEPYIESIFNITDGSTYETLFIEISAVNNNFDIAFIQGFSSDVYFNAFLAQLDKYELHYMIEKKSELNVPTMILP